MPPTEIEIWGGDEKNKLRLLKKMSPVQTSKKEKDIVRVEGIKIDLKPTTFKYYKIVAKNLLKLPSWHPGKGEKGWFFVDEVFFN